jgi:mannose-6-phosphate isomerase-like protein (cupin superfamily)
MPQISAAENERSALHFHREQVAEGVLVAHVAIRKGENSLFHHHTRTRDTFYVMEGELTVTIRFVGDRVPYHAIASTKPRMFVDEAGQPTHRVTLLSGEVLVVEPGVVHCASNLQDAVCRFLCIEGVGEYDFIQEGQA